MISLPCIYYLSKNKHFYTYQDSWNGMNGIIIFDYDGTIIDSLDTFMELFLTACQNEKNCPISTPTEFLDLFQGNMFEKMMQRGMTKESILRVVYQVRDGLYAHHSTLSTFPGIKKAIEDLSKKHKLYIITSNDTNVVKDFLHIKKLEFFIDIYGSDKGASKVDKIQHINQQIQHGEVFYVGDTVGDIIEGKQAGVTTIGVTWGWHSDYQLKQSAPNYIVNTPQELVDILSSNKTSPLSKTNQH